MDGQRWFESWCCPRTTGQRRGDDGDGGVDSGRQWGIRERRCCPGSTRTAQEEEGCRHVVAVGGERFIEVAHERLVDKSLGGQRATVRPSRSVRPAMDKHTCVVPLRRPGSGIDLSTVLSPTLRTLMTGVRHRLHSGPSYANLLDASSGTKTLEKKNVRDSGQKVTDRKAPLAAERMRPGVMGWIAVRKAARRSPGAFWPHGKPSLERATSPQVTPVTESDGWGSGVGEPEVLPS
jgi:hypothetical protein